MATNRVTLDSAAFLDSPQAGGLAEPARQHAASLVRLFLGCCYDELGKAPRYLDGDDMHAVLCHRLPAHLGRKDPAAAAVAEVLAAYLDFLEEREVVPQAFELRQRLAADAPELERLVRTGAAHVHGVPAGKGESFRHRGAKVGRNDPCPCGSNVKFKKCCGRLG